MSGSHAHLHVSRRLAAVVAAFALLLAAPALANASTAGPRSTATALAWYDLSRQTVAAAGYPEPITASRTWAVSWVAAARAAGREQVPQYQGAAFASALHDVLAALVPSQQAALDQQLAATLRPIRAGASKARAIDDGRDEAATALAERSNDGLDAASVDSPWSPPPAAPGVWQPTPPTFGSAVRAGQRFARPFLLTSADQFRPGPPPALDSQRYLDALAEVHAVGRDNGSTRTPTQTDAARFWAQNSIDAFVQVLRAVIHDGNRPLGSDARLVAGFHAITTDAQIAIYDAKYTYVFWRPVTAIRTGSVDQDPSWTPFLATPRHPEYPSGHAGYAGAAEAALATLAGPRPIKPVAVTSSTAPESTHTFAAWRAITEENINARVWEGVHFRFSDEVAAEVGRRVARFDLGRLSSLGL